MKSLLRQLKGGDRRLIRGVPEVVGPLVLSSSSVLIRREERFAKTAVGWVLRDLSKYEPRKVTVFVDEQLCYFSTESLRNALKYSPEATRRRYLRGMKTAQQQHAADGAARRR